MVNKEGENSLSCCFMHAKEYYLTEFCAIYLAVKSSIFYIYAHMCMYMSSVCIFLRSFIHSRKNEEKV